MTPHSFICTAPVRSENSLPLLTCHLLGQCLTIRGDLVDAARRHYGIFHSCQFLAYSPRCCRRSCCDIRPLKKPCRQNTSMFHSKDFVFHSALSSCPAANDALFTEKLNILRQNSNSPAKSCFRDVDNDITKKPADQSCYHVTDSHSVILFGAHFYSWCCNTTEVPVFALCFWLDFYTCRIFIRVHTNHFLKCKL